MQNNENRNVVLDLLRKSLHSQYAKQATQILQSYKRNPKFIIQLLLISDNMTIEINVRMASIILIKNLVYEHLKCPHLNLISSEDFQILKSSILQALIRNLQKNQQKLIPSIKYICYLMCKFCYKSNQWPNLVPQIINKLNNCSSVSSVKGALIIVKILFQILGKSLTQQVKLNNLSNKIILPLTNLASKMFSDLSQNSALFLIEILKIFTEAIQFHLPEIIQKNIHIFMVLIKNILDLKTNFQIQNELNYRILIKLLKIKNYALLFLQKMYQRHSTSNLISLKLFVQQFNQKYTKSFFQSIISIIMNCNNSNKNSYDTLPYWIIKTYEYLNFDLLKNSLGIFSFIASNKASCQLLLQELQKYQIKILYLSMEKFLSMNLKQISQKFKKISINFQNNNYQNQSQINFFNNYSQFIQVFHEQRKSLRFFLSAIFLNKYMKNRQKNIEQILHLILKCIMQGSLKQKQLALFLISSLQRDIQLLNEQLSGNLNEKMKILLKDYIAPLMVKQTNSQLKDNIQINFYSQLIQIRAYNIYSRFEYLEIDNQQCICICQQIFKQISMPAQNQMQMFLKIQVIETFNSLLSQNLSLIPQLAGQIPEILRIYTSLLLQEFQHVMVYYEQILSLFNEYVQPIVLDLLNLLTDLYLKLIKQNKIKLNSLNISENQMINSLYENESNKYLSVNNQQEQYDDYQQEQFIKNQSSSYQYDQKLNNDHYQNQNQENENYFQDQDEKYASVGAKCLSCIRKLISKHIQNDFSLTQMNLININVNYYELQQKFINLIMINLLSSNNSINYQIDQPIIKQTLAILNILLIRNFVCFEKKNKNIHDKFICLIRYFILDIINIKCQNGNYSIYQKIWNSVLQVNISESLSVSEINPQSFYGIFFKTLNKIVQSQKSLRSKDTQFQYQQTLQQDKIITFQDYKCCLKNLIRFLGKTKTINNNNIKNQNHINQNSIINYYLDLIIDTIMCRKQNQSLQIKEYSIMEIFQSIIEAQIFLKIQYSNQINSPQQFFINSKEKQLNINVFNKLVYLTLRWLIKSNQKLQSYLEKRKQINNFESNKYSFQQNPTSLQFQKTSYFRVLFMIFDNYSQQFRYYFLNFPKFKNEGNELCPNFLLFLKNQLKSKNIDITFTKYHELLFIYQIHNFILDSLNLNVQHIERELMKKKPKTKYVLNQQRQLITTILIYSIGLINFSLIIIQFYKYLQKLGNESQIKKSLQKQIINCKIKKIVVFLKMFSLTIIRKSQYQYKMRKIAQKNNQDKNQKILSQIQGNNHSNNDINQQNQLVNMFKNINFDIIIKNNINTQQKSDNNFNNLNSFKQQKSIEKQGQINQYQQKNKNELLQLQELENNQNIDIQSQQFSQQQNQSFFSSNDQYDQEDELIDNGNKIKIKNKIKNPNNQYQLNYYRSRYFDYLPQSQIINQQEDNLSRYICLMKILSNQFLSDKIKFINQFLNQ